MHETNVHSLSNQEQLTCTLLTQKQLPIYRKFFNRSSYETKTVLFIVASQCACFRPQFISQQVTKLIIVAK